MVAGAEDPLSGTYYMDPDRGIYRRLGGVSIYSLGKYYDDWYLGVGYTTYLAKYSYPHYKVSPCVYQQ